MKNFKGKKNFFKGKKTHIISILMGLTTVVRFASGDITAIDFLLSPDFNLLLQGLGLSSLRAGVAKGEI